MERIFQHKVLTEKDGTAGLLDFCESRKVCVTSVVAALQFAAEHWNESATADYGTIARDEIARLARSI